MSDYTMFRFRAINKHLLASLVNSEIYFAQPNCLNDPFDWGKPWGQDLKI